MFIYVTCCFTQKVAWKQCGWVREHVTWTGIADKTLNGNDRPISRPETNELMLGLNEISFWLPAYLKGPPVSFLGGYVWS